MGVVYRAVDPVLARRVAIKVMNEAIAQETELRERFLREAQAAGSLQHPNVVTIYDFGEVDGHLYIAMEYVEGEDLEDLLKKQIPISLDAILELMIGVLQGLSFAHKRGVVHRDIKPANIRVDEEGKARIMDFGVAHLASSNMTKTGVMVGTPSYMAPEQIMGAPVSAETDIFSVGAVLYELLTGKKPFGGDTLQTLMYQILSTTPPPVTEVRRQLPSSLDRIVMRALAKEPKDRYPRAGDMANDLITVRAALSQAGTRTSLSLRATIETALAQRTGEHQRAQRRQRLTIAGGALAVVLALAAVYGLSQRGGGGELGAASDGASAATVGAPSPAPSVVATATPPAVADSSALVSPPASPPPRTAVAPSVSAAPSPTAREISLARALQNSALQARRRASDAGATADQLRVGDVYEASGATALRRGQVADAASAFDQAAAAWSAAERAARAVTIAATTTAAPPPASPPVTEIPRPNPVPIPVKETAETVGESPGNPPVEIAAVVAAYARALDSRNIAEMQRVYPGMTTSQRRAFEDFFRSTRSLNATLAVSSLQVDGMSAEAHLTGTYVYVTTDGATERRPVAFHATLRRESGAWRLVAVR